MANSANRRLCCQHDRINAANFECDSAPELPNLPAVKRPNGPRTELKMREAEALRVHAFGVDEFGNACGAKPEFSI
jgi:hypothetical protein